MFLFMTDNLMALVISIEAYYKDLDSCANTPNIVKTIWHENLDLHLLKKILMLIRSNKLFPLCACVLNCLKLFYFKNMLYMF